MTDAAATPQASTGTTFVPDTGASSPQATIEEPTVDHPTNAPPSSVTPDEEPRTVRRRLQDDAATTADLDKLHLINAPQFLGKTPVNDIEDILLASNLSTHTSKIYIDQIKEPKDSIPGPA